MEINEYYFDFMQQIFSQSGAEENFTEAVFTEVMCDFLVDQAIIENYSYIGYKKSTRGIRADAWDYNDDTGVLCLFVTDYRQTTSLEGLSQTEVIKNFKRLEKFISESLKLDFLAGLEESSSGYDLAREIYFKNKNSSISKIRLFLLSNSQLSMRVNEIGKSTAEGYPCSYDVWDFSRIYRINSSGHAREEILINFTNNHNEGLPCLPAFLGSEELESYLLVLPGDILAQLYDQYGERLLEQNVRTFLQFRGNVNKGIRNTIQNEPEMFFAYNNGISATAEQVVTDHNKQILLSVKNFQIVNGGQTTASIYTASKKGKMDLSKVYVQVKLTVINPENVEEIVPRISEFANTQNKVSAADFFSNHPFHLRMEEFSRRLWAPSSDGALRETHWYYERARGQFINAQANLTPAQKKEFLLRNPRSQMFTKTDLAKFENSASMQPHIVSLGAQKNFANFASDIARKWEQNNSYYNELNFQTVIAKAILFRFLDKNIMKQPWYGGYKANIVTYSIAIFFHSLVKINKTINFSKIWKEQRLSATVERQLLVMAAMVNIHIQDTPQSITNVTEWCKKELCWKELMELDIPINDDINPDLIDAGELFDKKKAAEKVQQIDNGINSQAYVLEKGSEYWKKASAYGIDAKLFSPKEMDILSIACQIPHKIPSEKQSMVLLRVEERIRKEGFAEDRQ